MANSYVNGATKAPKSPENTPKDAKKQQPIESQKNTKTEIQAKWGNGFYIYLARGTVRPYVPSPVTPLSIGSNRRDDCLLRRTIAGFTL